MYFVTIIAGHSCLVGEKPVKSLVKEWTLNFCTTTTHLLITDDLPDFSTASKRARSHPARRRELLTSEIGGQVTLAQNGAMSKF